MKYCFITEPSIPGAKVDPNFREIQKQARSNSIVEPIVKVQFPPSIDEKIFIKSRKVGSYPSKAPNPFFFYRKQYVLQLKDSGKSYPMTDISCHVSRSWKNEPEYVREYYKELSKKASVLVEAHRKDPYTVRKPKRKKSPRSSNKKSKKDTYSLQQPSSLIDTTIAPQHDQIINAGYINNIHLNHNNINPVNNLVDCDLLYFDP
ncbi:15921_t:CDS:1, partial [Racocetra persica]